MRIFTLLSLMTLGTPAFADRVCWDGTFGYNYVRAVETDKGLELSLQGSSLGLPPLSAGNGHSLLFADFTAGSPQLHIVIPKKAVQTKNGVTTAEIKGTVADSFEGRTPSLWVSYTVMDLDRYKPVLTPIPLLGFKATITSQFIQFNFTQIWSYTEQGDHRNDTIEVSCTYKEAPDDLRLPARLKRFLARTLN